MAEAYFITTFNKVGHLSPFRCRNQWWAKTQGCSCFSCTSSGAPKAGEINGPNIRVFPPRQKVGLKVKK